MNAPIDPVVRFGAFELDLRTGELRKTGVRVNLPEQPFQVLKALLDRPGDLVTREELREHLWPAETFVDFEHGLNAAVRRLRDALGDSAERPRFVETLPRRGYRFIAPLVGPALVEQPAPPAPVRENRPDGAEAADVISSPPPTRTRTPLFFAASILVALVVFGTTGYLLWRLSPSPAAPSASRSMLAVLPFENMTGDPNEEYISDGMTEELIAQLGGIDPSRLGVIARRSAMQFKKTTKPAEQIGAELGVSHLLEGSLRRTGSRIRIAVQLVDTQSQSQLWAEQYERDANDLLTLQREIATAVSRQIANRLRVASANVNADIRRHSTIAEAYEHYLRGSYHWRQDTTDGLQKAMEHFRRAIQLDPSYALAYSGLADTYTLIGSYGLLPMSEAYPLGRVAALKALELDDTLGEAHNSLAAITADYDWNWADAERHFKRAIELEPNYETALRFYSFYLACMGRHEEALEFAERARRVDPVSPLAHMNVANILYFARRYDAAIVELADTLDLAPDFGPARVLLGRVYLAKGMPDRAVEELKRAEDVMGHRPDVTTPHAYVLARAGRQREARAVLDELRRISKPRDPAPIRLAMIYLGLGETDRAFEWLEKALQARDWQMAMLNVEPTFDVLRSDPRFAALVQRVGLPR